MKKLIKILVVLAVLLVVAVFIGSFFIGSIIKTGVETVGPKVAKVPIKLDSASLSMLGGMGGMKGLVVGNPEGYKTESAIKVGKVHLAVAPGSIMSDKIVIKSIEVRSPEITLESNAGLNFAKDNNLTKIQQNIEAFLGSGGDKKPADTTDKEAKAASKKLQVDELTLTGIKINLALNIPGINNAPITIPDIKLTNLGTGPEGITPGAIVEQVTRQLFPAIFAAVLQKAGDLGNMAGKAAESFGKQGGGALTNTLNQATKGIGDLFKKK